MKLRLRTVLLALTGLAIVILTLGGLALNLQERINAAHQRIAVQTQRLAAAGVPLLLNALVVGDLASAEQMLKNVNVDLAWRYVRLYEQDGSTVILDTSPSDPPTSRVPAWVRRFIRVNVQETRIAIRADPVVYGVLAVTPSSANLEEDLWNETRVVITTSVLMLVALLVVIRVIVDRGLRPVRALAESAARFGRGDFSARMPPTTLVEIAPTVDAFNTMASDLQRGLDQLRQREVELASQSTLLRAILENLDQGLSAVDRNLRVVAWNQRFVDLLELPARLVQAGTPFADVIRHHAERGEFGPGDIEQQINERVTRARLFDPHRFEHARPDGTVLEIRGNPMPGGGFVTTYTDVTERKRVEDETRRARDAAVEASRAKSEFLANMSHEIRTPMNAIIGLSELALGTELTAEQQEYLTLVQSSGVALLHVINELLDFSKIEAGRLVLETIDFALRINLGDALKSLALRAHEKGLELTSAIDPDVPDNLVGDPVRLRQVLVNLVGNAIKFTERGEVRVTVEVAARDEGAVSLHFAVADSGIGIRADKRSMIFDPFSQADSSTTRRFGGTGLGLAIARQLVDLMGGRIWVESEEGVGSTFHFTVRVELGTTATTQESLGDMALLRGCRVLVVDDNATSRRIIAGTLTAAGALPVVVDGGEAAWAELERTRAAGTPMELVVTDHLMPGLDGPSLVAWMRGDPGFSNIPIVMLSSSGLRGEARSLIPGLAGYLTKPVTEAELLRALLTALRRHPATMQSSPSRVAAAGRGRSLRVLLAEDNVINQKVAVRLLERLGHRVTVVGDGRSVLAALEAQVYDVVLMDVQMPEMDGLEATRAVRAREAELAATGSASAEGSFAAWRTAGCRIPVVALTAHAMKSDEERCLAAGMNGYMAKPVTGEALARALVQFVPMGDLASESPSEEIPACAALLRGPTPRSGRPHGERSTDSPVDLVAALNRVDGDREFLAELGELLVQEWPTRRQELHVALGEGDAGRLERSAHGLKGSLAALGARTASSLAAQLELIARERRLEGAPPVLVELDAELDRTIAFFADPTALREALITPSR